MCGIVNVQSKLGTGEKEWGVRGVRASGLVVELGDNHYVLCAWCLVLVIGGWVDIAGCWGWGAKSWLLWAVGCKLGLGARC